MRLRRDAVRQPDERLVLRPGAEAEQLGGREIARRDVDPRAERRADADVAGALVTTPVMTNRASPSDERVAHARVERAEQRRVHHHAPTLLQRAPRRARGRCGSRRRTDSPARPPPPAPAACRWCAARRPCPRSWSGAPPRRRAARSESSTRSAAGVSGRRLREREVGAEQRARLAAHRVAQVVGERVDRHQRGDADRHRRGEQQQAPGRRADLARGHAEGERRHGRSVTRRCRPRPRRRPAGSCAAPARRGRGRASPAPASCPGRG